jgi:CRISPR-associated protein Cmx8
MAQIKKSVQVIDTLELNYNLAELPSSQHRAGLAGLVLMVRWLHRFEAWKQDGTAICEIDNLTDHSVTLRINQLGLQALFNEVYGASWEEKLEYKPRKNDDTGDVIQPIRTEEVPDKDPKTGKVKIDKKTGQPKTKTAYFYPVVVPKGSFLSDRKYGGDGQWIKLWRDALKSSLKVKPKSLNKYKVRAEQSSQLSNTEVWKDISQTWINLAKHQEVLDIGGSLYLGIQGKNAEAVGFKDRAKYEFLLHFWFFSIFIYVPQILKLEKNKDQSGETKWKEKHEFVGYAIAIPDVANLKIFCDEFLGLLGNRGNEVTGYRPRDAVVDLAVEGALDMMARLRDRLSRLGTRIGDLVMGIDVVHVETTNDKKRRLRQEPSQNNDLLIHGSTRLDPPEPQWIDQYREIRENLWHATFRRQRLLNLVSNKAWYMGFDSLLCTIPYELTIENNYFCHDVRESFKYEVENMSEETEQNLNSEVTEYSCEKLVLRLVKSYVLSKLESKYQLKWSEVQGTPKESEYREKKAKIAKSAFLDVRSRTEKMDFINYFASTICSVSQRMSEDSFEKLTRDLYEDTDKVRTLTMLALSANS